MQKCEAPKDPDVDVPRAAATTMAGTIEEAGDEIIGFGTAVHHQEPD
jgi:hypothetical protein